MIYVDITPAKNGNWSAHHDGETLFESKRDPETNACRILQSRGMTGEVAFRHKDGSLGLETTIDYGASRTVSENEKNGPRWQKWYPNDFFSRNDQG